MHSWSHVGDRVFLDWSGINRPIRIDHYVIQWGQFFETSNTGEAQIISIVLVVHQSTLKQAQQVLSAWQQLCVKNDGLVLILPGKTLAAIYANKS